MQRSMLALGFIAFTAVAAPPVFGQARPTATRPPEPNAASLYLLAFKQLPPGTEDILEGAAKADPIDWLKPIEEKKLAEVVQHADPPIALLHRASAIKRCDWTEVFAATQPSATQPADMEDAANDLYLSEALLLIALGGTKAADLFEKKQADEGAQCACDAMDLCARGPKPQGLLAQMVPMKLFESMDDLLAEHLTELTPGGLKAVQLRLNDLPHLTLNRELVQRVNRSTIAGWATVSSCSVKSSMKRGSQSRLKSAILIRESGRPGRALRAKHRAGFM